MLRRIGSRDELERSGEITVVGEVATLPRRVRVISKRDDQPNREIQMYEESIHSLRTYLMLVQSLKGMQVLAVASSVSQEGKTTVACHLAMSLASSTGEPTLLIDGDIRSPDIHRIFSVDPSLGLANVLCDEASVEQAVTKGFIDALHLLPAESHNQSTSIDG